MKDHDQPDQWMIPRPAPSAAMRALTAPPGCSTRRMVIAGSRQLQIVFKIVQSACGEPNSVQVKHKIQECLQYFLDSKYFRIITIFFLVCEPGWTLFEPTGKCYRKYSNGKNWTEARSTCQGEVENGDLASIPNQATNDFILTLFQNHKAKKWIGGYDYDEEGVWKWTDGTPWQYQNWEEDNPSNVNEEDFLAIDLKSGKWWDMIVTKQLHFICQYNP